MPIDIHTILSELDTEIERLRGIRAALTGEESTPAKRRGRPKGSKTAASSEDAPVKKRTMSPEGRKRIAEAQRKRWAAKKA